MLEECATHFEKRYRYVPSQNTPEGIEFFAGIHQLSGDQRDKCDKTITEEDLTATLRAMHNGSSPGPDGFTTGFYKALWQELKDLVTQVVDEMLDKNSIPELLKESFTTLIPKKGKDRRSVNNLRLII